MLRPYGLDSNDAKTFLTSTFPRHPNWDHFYSDSMLAGIRPGSPVLR
jgi:hypothetical protein